jgi:hypothetical protein
VRSSNAVSLSLAAAPLGYCVVVEKGCVVVVSIDRRGPSTSQLAKCASCFVQDDGLWVGLEGW